MNLAGLLRVFAQTISKKSCCLLLAVSGEKMILSHCLFLVEDWPITPNAVGGAPALIYSHLELLVRAGCDVSLVILSTPGASHGFADFVKNQPHVWKIVKGWCHSHHILELEPSVRARDPFQNLVLGLRSPDHYLYGHIMNDHSMGTLRQLLDTINPTFIWAEHLLPATLAQRATSDIPIIYSHHDWRWRIKKYRNRVSIGDWRSKFQFWVIRRHEEALVRKVTGCVSASVTEAAEICSIGAKETAYFSTSYLPTNISNIECVPARPRLVHLGGMQSTANQIGLQRFLKIAWPKIYREADDPPELWIIGSLSGASASLLADLLQAGAVCTGFVKDLSSVLRPYDIHIVPWEHNTGTRTRIPLIMNYAQVLVATNAGAGCIAELQHGQNSILVPGLSQMADEILTLLSNSEDRKRLALAGRETFMTSFTREALQPRFNAFLKTFEEKDSSDVHQQIPNARHHPGPRRL